MNYHPPLVSVPVAFLSAIFLLELLSLLPRAKPHRTMLRFTIRCNAVICLIGIVAAFISGYPAGEQASQTFIVPDGVVGDHHLIGRFLLFASVPWIVLCFCRDYAKFNRRLFEGGYYLFLIICFSLTVYCGYLGGRLVFTYGAGVAAVSEIAGVGR